MFTARPKTGETPETAGMINLDPALDKLLRVRQRIARSLGPEGQELVFQALIDQIPDLIFVKDLGSRFVVSNRALAQAYGRTPEELVGLTDFDLHPTELAQDFYSFEQQVMRTGAPMFDMEESFPDPHGTPKWYSTTKVPLRTGDGTLYGLIGIARDITERKRLQDFEAQQADILAMIATNVSISPVLEKLVALIESQLFNTKASVLLFDAEAGCLRHGAAPSLPEAFCRVVDGVAIGSSVGSCGTAAFRRQPVFVADTWTDPLWASYRYIARQYDLRSCTSTPIFGREGRLLGTFALYSSVVHLPDANETRLVAAATRIAGIAIESHQAELQLVRMAHYDSMTQLPNRVLFRKRLIEALLQRRTLKRKVALLYIDLDGFKQINDLLGHFVGDRLLSAVGDRLRIFASETVTMSRLGGDEFAVIQELDISCDRPEIEALALSLVAALRVPYQIEGHQIVVGATAGVAIAPEHDDDPEGLLRDADLALYQAKADERGSARFFEPAMVVRAQLRHEFETDLRDAVETWAFALRYQPIVDLASTKICGFEALLRWKHPRRGLVSPHEFVPIAEEMGLIVPIGEWTLRHACWQAALWPANIKLAVNLSPVQFRDGRLVDTVCSALSSSGLSPERLELEVTESVLLADNAANLEVLHRIRRLGVQISLDDFGTGYSSLSYLRSFPFTKIKIDRSFVSDLEANNGCRAIVHAVSHLASDLGMITTAEGVETRNQLDLLRLEGCDQGQGFLFSEPVPFDETSRLIAGTV